MATRRKILFRWIKVVLLLYGVIGILFYYLQNKIFFHPKALPASYQYSFGDQKFEELNLAYNSQSNINIILFKPATDTPRGVVLFFHGNRRNIEHYAEYAPVFTSHQYEVWMIDYPGFGKSTGQFSEPVSCMNGLYSFINLPVRVTLPIPLLSMGSPSAPELPRNSPP